LVLSANNRNFVRFRAHAEVRAIDFFTQNKKMKGLMQQWMWALVALCCTTVLVGCNDYETYGDKKEKERKAIRQFLADSAFVVISEAQFHEQGDVTDVDKRQFVYLNNSGVYMQIQRRGCGTPLYDGENTNLIVRFCEISLLDSTALYNDIYPYDLDIMNVRRSGSSYSATFVSGLMYQSYSTSVPSGWLAVFPYINVGRPRSASDEISKVRLIVPHSQGHVTASNYVYPYYYELSFQRTIDTDDTD